MRLLTAAVATIAFAAIAPAAALAEPPANDARANPVVLKPPGSVEGTTAESTLEPDESTYVAGTQVSGSVWYEMTTAQARRVIVRLAAAGDLDAAVEVFRRSRSQLLYEAAGATDEEGRMTVVFDSRASSTYLIRVAQRANSVPGTFALEVLLPQPPPSPPGPLLRPSGVAGAVNPVTNAADAWSAVLREGVTYRINLVNLSRRRLLLALFAPGTRSFDAAPALRQVARSYLLFTPGAGQGGRYSFLISASGLDGRQPYRLDVGQAELDDLWPGRGLRNYQRLRAGIDATGLDVIDTYRFDVASRSAVALRLRSAVAGAFDLRLLRSGGKRIATLRGVRQAAELKEKLPPGRYVAVVRARRGTRGTYTLRRIARIVTRLRLERGGSGPVDSGTAVDLDLRLRPGQSGPAVVTIERLDPLTGWHFDRTIRTRVVDGRAAVRFLPPAIGRWRARATFEGTRRSEESTTRRDVEWAVV